VPYQHKIPSKNERIVPVKSPKEIKDTVLTLMEAIPDDEWIYWSIDDKYPEQLNEKVINRLYKEIIEKDDHQFDGLLFSSRYLRHSIPSPDTEPYKIVAGIKLLPRYDLGNIWLHQFIRAGIIKDIFRQFPNKISAAKEMDDLKYNITFNREYKFYRTLNNYGFFGESMSAGKLTRNCFDSMKKMGIEDNQIPVNQKQYYYIGYPIQWKFKIAYFKFFARRLKWEFRKILK
jgi:hypothetical protein